MKIAVLTFTQYQEAKPRNLDKKQMINSFLVMFTHACDASILQELVLNFKEKNPNRIIAPTHDSFGIPYDLVNEYANYIKWCYYNLGFDNHVLLIEKCIIKPNMLNDDLLTESEKKLEVAVFEILLDLFKYRFPEEDNILTKYKGAVLASCYWYPYSD